MTTHRLRDLHPPARAPRPALQVRASVHVAHPAVRRDAHPPLGRGALPRRGDGHGRPHPRRAGDECEGDGEHGGLLGGRADHPQVRAAMGGDSEWARAADHRDRRLERRIRSSSASR